MRTSKFIECLLLVALAFAGWTGTALAADPDPRQILAPSGKLKAGLYPGTPTSILPNPPAEPRGVGYELGKELAKRLGVPYEPVVFSKNAEVLAAVKDGSVDVVLGEGARVLAEPQAVEPCRDVHGNKVARFCDDCSKKGAGSRDER